MGLAPKARPIPMSHAPGAKLIRQLGYHPTAGTREGMRRTKPSRCYAALQNRRQRAHRVPISLMSRTPRAILIQRQNS